MNNYPEDFLKAVALTLKVEGGYSNRPPHEDPGGATNLGITEGLLKDIGGWHGKRDVRQLSEADAVGIYYKHFWQRFKCGSLPWPLSCAVFDHCVNAGAHGVKVLQSMLNEFVNPRIAVDGGIGPQTLGALEKTLTAVTEALRRERTESLALLWLTVTYLFRRLRDYANRPAKSIREANMSGWTNRVCDLENKLLHE